MPKYKVLVKRSHTEEMVLEADSEEDAKFSAEEDYFAGAVFVDDLPSEALMVEKVDDDEPVSDKFRDHHTKGEGP